MTIFKKRLFCIVAACFMLILPFISWGGGTTKEAKADSTTTVYSFRGSNLTFPCAVFNYGIQGTQDEDGLWQNNYILAKADYYYNGFNSRVVGLDERRVGGHNRLSPLVYLSPVYPPLDSGAIASRPTSFVTFEFGLLGDGDNITVCYNLVYSNYVPQDNFTGLDVYYDLYGYLNPRPLRGNNRAEISLFDNTVGSSVQVSSGSYQYVYFSRVNSAENAQSLLSGQVFPQAGADCDAVMRLYVSSSDFIPNISRVELGNVSASPISDDNYFMTSIIYLASYGGYGLYRIKMPYNYVRYYDTNNNYLEIAIPYFSQWEVYFAPLVKYDLRTYYLSEYVSDTDSYELGKAAGIIEGEANKAAAIKAAVNANSVEWAGIIDERVAAELELAKDVVYNEGFQAGANKTFGWGMFMSSTLDVLNIPIFGEFGLGDMFMVVFGVGLVIIVLKIFAGG